MTNYILRRLFWGLLAICIITCVNFVIIKLVPGDPVRAMLGDYPAPRDYVERVTRELGLDQPLHIQFVRYVTNLAQGDFGFSFSNRRPVLPLILDRAQYTLLLILPSIVVSVVLGIVLAMVSARRSQGAVDNSISAVVALGYSMPSFWLGQILVLIFAIGLSWLPAAGLRSLRVQPEGLSGALDVMKHMILPMICVVSFKLAIILRVARASIMGVLQDDFVITARAKGVPEREIMRRHILPNALIPVIAVTGYQFGHALTSSILVETVFAWPGLGSLFIDAVTNRDFPVLQGILVLSTVLVVAANLIADIVASYADPRVRRNLGARSGRILSR